jgi:hypothetical protein
VSAVDDIREASALMRERANAASPSGEGYAGGWNGYSLADDPNDGRAEMYCGPAENGYRTGHVFSFGYWDECEECGRPSSADVAHIASWHPNVALAVAAWLDQAARLHDGGSTGPLDTPAAHVLALTYLGRAS